jgi:hypothetical protein
VELSQITFDKPKSASLTTPIPPPPTPSVNTPSSSLSSSPNGFSTLSLLITGIGSKRIFSGLISLKKKINKNKIK